MGALGVSVIVLSPYGTFPVLSPYPFPQEAQRNLAVNLWYESSTAAAGARLSSVEPLFQAEGCPGHGHKAPQGGGGAKQEL